MSSVPSPSHEPDDMAVQKAVPFSPRVGVVEVGQAKVVAELVREHAEAAILGLDGVVTNPDSRHRRSGHRRTGSRRPRGRSDAEVGRVDIPAVGPDRIRALGAAAGVLALTGVNRLEVIQVSVRLVKVAVVVVVVAVPDVEGREIRLDLRLGLAGALWLLVPGIPRVLDELPGAAEVLDRVVAVEGGVTAATVTQPLDLTGDGVMTRRLRRVEVGERVTGSPKKRSS